MKYIVTFQDNTRKNFLSLESLCENLEESDALNVPLFFTESYPNGYRNPLCEYEAIWEGEHWAEPCLISMA